MKNILLISLLLVCLAGKSQTGVVRLEFEAAINSDIYELIPLGNQGFLVFFETKDLAGENSKNWFFTFYNTSFTEVWKANIPIVADASYQDYIRKDSILYLFFLNTDKVKPGTENFQLLTLDLAKGISYETKGNLPAESTFVRFCIAGTRIFLGLNLKNDQAAIYSIDLKSGPINEFRLTYPDQNFIEDIIYDPFHDQILSIVSNYLSRRQNKIYMLVLSVDAGFIYDMEISPVTTGKYLNTARIYAADSTHQLLIGTYGNIASKMPSANEYFGIESTGVFATRISERKQEFMNYYNFMEFRNLRAGVSARDFYRLQKKKERESPEYSMNYELLTHEPELHDSTLVIMLEAFYPEFRTVSDISYDYWGRPVTHTYNVFEGYRFFNSILTGFNLNGELVWDNSLEVNISPTNRLDQKTAYFFDGEPAILFYNDGSKISYRICLENAELEPFTKLDLETSEFGDMITTVGQNRLVHWYDYYFLAYGYHTIRNNMLTDKNERTVFYINKISLE
jgi:hypothetical protein